MPQTKWHLNHNLHLSKQTLTLTAKPLLLKRKVANRISGFVHMWTTIQEDYDYMKLPFWQAQNDMIPPSLVRPQLPSSKTHWERTGPFYCMLHPLCLRKKGSKRLLSFKRVQDNRVEELPPFTEAQLQYLKGSAAPGRHDRDELEAHVVCYTGAKSIMLRQQDCFFPIRLKAINCLKYILGREVLQNLVLFPRWESMLKWWHQ